MVANHISGQEMCAQDLSSDHVHSLLCLKSLRRTTLLSSGRIWGNARKVGPWRICMCAIDSSCGYIRRDVRTQVMTTLNASVEGPILSSAPVRNRQWPFRLLPCQKPVFPSSSSSLTTIIRNGILTLVTGADPGPSSSSLPQPWCRSWPYRAVFATH